MRKCLCALVRNGHAQAWDYGWSFFLEALDELAAALKAGIGRL